MAYRFTDTMKWQDEWFVDLNAIEKLLFMYLCDNCDIAGFFEASYRKIAFDLSLKETEIKGAIKGLERGLLVSDDKRCLLVKNFIRHQKNLPINPENKSHQGILKRVDIYLPKFSNVSLDYQKGYIHEGASKPLGRGTGIGIGIGIDSLGTYTAREENSIPNFDNAESLKKPEKKSKIFTPPSLEEVLQYFNENGYTKYSAEKAYQHYNLANWHDTNGKPVLSWKQKMSTVWFKPENKKPTVRLQQDRLQH